MRAYSVFLALLLLQRATTAPQAAPSRDADSPSAITVTAVDDLSQTALEGVTVQIAPTTSVRIPTVLKAVTSSDGQLTVAGLASGTYLVIATPPDLYASTNAWFPSTNGQVRTVVVKRGEHPTVRFTFKRPPFVSGLVQTEDGKAAVGVSVELLESQTTVHDRPVLAVTRTAATDASGRFIFEKLKPGQYYVRSRPSAGPSAALNFIYAPGTTTQRDLTPLTLEPGDEVSVGISLRNLPAVQVRGRVVEASGEPARNVLVTLTALDRTARALSVPVTGPGSELAYAALTDESGQFVVPLVFQGLYALRGVARRDAGMPIRAAGVAEVEVAASDVSDVLVTLAAPARITGQFMFNGADDPDPARTQLTMAPDGEHGHLRVGLATSDAWHADGQFEVEGIIGPQRLMLGSSGAWYIERATLEDGTEIGNYPYTFAPGRLYPNVRVWVSDRVASVSGPLPPWWDAAGRPVIVVFPEDASLRTSGSRHVRYATVSRGTGRFSVLGVPPGQVYLVAGFVQASVEEPLSEPFFQLLTPGATRIAVDDAQPYEVALGAPFKR